MNVVKILKLILYFGIVGFISLFTIPFLGAFILSFGIVALVAIPVGIVRTFFNISWISMSFLGYDIPKPLSIPFAIFIFLISFIFSFISYKLLKMYFSFIIDVYNKLNK